MKRVVIILLTLVLSVNVTEAQSRKVKKAIAKRERQEKQEKREYEKTRKKVVKHRYDIQTDKTRERMKETLKKSKDYNKQRRKGFFDKLFDKRKRNIRKKRRRR